MIKLCGFALSNYYNKVKFVLLEHGIPFEEVRAKLRPGRGDCSSASPLGKVPYIETEDGDLLRIASIVEYLAARLSGQGDLLSPIRGKPRRSAN